MADYKKLISFIKKWEGGWVNDPHDKGGATMSGITMVTYEAYCKKKGYPKPTIEKLKNIPDDQWNDIFKSMYWDRCNADKIENQSVANAVVDWYWNSGIYGIRIPQRILGLREDGIIGTQTIAAINMLPSKELFEDIKAERLKFVENIAKNNPSQSKFLNGWKNRINDLKFTI